MCPISILMQNHDVNNLSFRVVDVHILTVESTETALIA